MKMDVVSIVIMNILSMIVEHRGMWINLRLICWECLLVLIAGNAVIHF